jgi:hypothetical protein
VGDVAAIVNATTIANTEDSNDELRDRNPNPPRAKRQTHFGNGSRECDHSPYSKPPYGVKKFVAQPGQTTNYRVPANEK